MINLITNNRIGSVMVSVLVECDRRWVRAPVGSTKDYEFGICWFSAKHAELRRKNKDWLDPNQNNVSKWGDTSIRDCCFNELAL